MILLSFIIGLALPAILGWLTLHLIEGSHSVLQTVERWCIGFILGSTLSMYSMFLCHTLLGVPLTRAGYLVVFFTEISILSALLFARKTTLLAKTIGLHTTKSLSTKQMYILCGLGAWLALKIASVSFLLIASPPYHDDVISNWNYRAKNFFVQEQIVLELPMANPGVNSYPPSVPMIKTWMAALNGEWSHGLANSIHMFWFLGLLCIFYFTLRRFTGVFWSAIGTYVLGSMPLVLIHASVAYADIFVSAHIFIALSMLIHALRTSDAAAHKRLICISALSAALLVFTKNEALVLYLPPLLLAAITSIVWTHTEPERKRMIIGYALVVSSVLLPWFMFKWKNDLGFANAKEVSSMQFGWQPGVLYSVWINTFFEGNWILLFPALLFLLYKERVIAFSKPIIVLTTYVLVVYFGQLTLFMFTSLSVEALQQTGYARGVLQLIPCICLLVTLLGIQTMERIGQQK